MQYRDEILDLFKNPLNMRVIKDGKKAREMNASCGDMIEVYVTTKDGVVVDCSWKGVGCAMMVASASLLSEEAKGKGVNEVLEWDRDKLAEILGEVNVGREKCISLPLVTLKKALV
jgi:nitrogen fixation NifU-like protein